MKVTKVILTGLVTASIASVAIADDIGHGGTGPGAEAEPAEERDPSKSSTGSFFNELLAIFELESSD